VATCNDTNAGGSPRGGAQLGEQGGFWKPQTRDEVECQVWHVHTRHVLGATECRATSLTEPIPVNPDAHLLRLQQICRKDRYHRSTCPTDWTSGK
jgi:hypothetical protein